MWAGISSKGIVGPFFFDGTVTANAYLEMLENQVWPTIAQWPDIDEFWFQHDGAPAHFGIEPRDWLNDHFPDRWIGRRGAIEWPPRSPDLTPPDFFLWGVLKDKVYGLKPQNIDQLRTAITNACQEIPTVMVQNACRSVLERWDECIQANGTQFEHKN